MYEKWKPFLSVLGVPLVGLGTLLLSLGHPASVVKPEASDASMMVLIEPDSKLDKSRIILLRQQAKQVRRFQNQLEPQRLTQAISDYNLLAHECTPAVFQVTHLPSSLE